MAVVYKVWQPELERWVALKKCKNPQDLPAFHKEAKLMAALKHPALAQIHSLNHDELTMEFIEGHTLRDATIDAHRLMEQLLEVLEYLHGENIILKDLKPENIMVQPDQKIKVLDLGIAKRVEEGTQLLLKGVGSEFYSPPEQYGHGTTDQRSDFYSLGATLYFAITRTDPPPAWERLSKGIPISAPGPLGQLIHQLTQLKPQDRPESVKAIRNLLRPVPPKERTRKATPEITERQSYPLHGLLAWGEDGLWVAADKLTNLSTQEVYGNGLKPLRIEAHQHRVAVQTNTHLHLKEKGRWSQHKGTFKDLAVTHHDVLLLGTHLEFQHSKKRFPTGWGKRFSHCAADETHVAAGGPGLKVWDRGGTLLWENSQPSESIRFHGPFLFTHHKEQLTLYQADTGQKLSQIQTTRLERFHLTDRHLIAIRQQTVSFWDYTQGQQLLKIDLPEDILSSALKNQQLAVSTRDKLWVLTFSE